MAQEKSTKGSGRTRNFATVVYPESAPSNWKEILSDTHVPAFISPLHDKDKNPSGEPKKSHYHVLIMFDSVKTQAQADEIFKQIGGVGHETVNSIRGYARYLTHMDNPEKYQYKAEDVIALGGADYRAVCQLPSDDMKTTRDMIQFINANHIKSFSQFVNFCSTYKEDWFIALLQKNTYFIKEYIKSCDWTDENGAYDYEYVDPADGVIYKMNMDGTDKRE